MADTTIPDLALTTILDALHTVNVHVAQQYPGDGAARQPVHTVYGGAHLFKSDVAKKLGTAALKALQEHAPDAATLADALHLDRAIAERLYPRVVDKLTREPVEDFRIDFEDGFGSRPDLEEDGHAQLAATEMANGLSDGTLPPSIGIRIKTLNEETKRRGLRTFDLFLTRLLDRTEGRLPRHFLITLPKITSVEQVTAMAAACDAFEYWRQLPAGTLKFELMVETTQSIIAPDGTAALPRLITAGRGRIVAAHFGTYDYTAACGVTAAHQHMRHPACDFAKDVMQVTLAGTGVWLSDGATNVMPIGSRESVHAAWRLHAEHVRHSLVTGFYQGWDLHPAQLPSRYAAVYAFFLEGLDAASERLKNFVAKAAQATLAGDVFDDAATGQGLLNYFLRAMNCGAISEEEAVALSGLAVNELRSRSFATILKLRMKNNS
ncbi:MAG: phosphoenolpyruvate kinase [Acidobacteria bacterium]|nr:phosphoenolpyruvate kinase [Acidobacteriota bacterium]